MASIFTSTGVNQGPVTSELFYNYLKNDFNSMVVTNGLNLDDLSQPFGAAPSDALCSLDEKYKCKTDKDCAGAAKCVDDTRSIPLFGKKRPKLTVIRKVCQCTADTDCKGNRTCNKTKSPNMCTGKA